MMYYLESDVHDPYYNLALEQVVFDRLSREHSYFMLWQNDNAVIVGKHQNTAGEINAAFVKENNITVARRLSGGGAVYHDMGNVNFTFIADAENAETFDFSAFCTPVAKALGSMGVGVEISGRNDMTIGGRKFSGNAMYIKSGRVMHHGTILFDSDLSVVAAALNVPKDKIESKGIKSAKSRVTNIKPFIGGDMSVNEFMARLKSFFISENSMKEYEWTAEDLAEAARLRESVYSRWEWNYGASPAYTVRKERRVEGVGKVEAFLDIDGSGVIKNAELFGDYFGNRDSSELAEKLVGVRMEERRLREALASVNIGDYINRLDTEGFISILLL